MEGLLERVRPLMRNHYVFSLTPSSYVPTPTFRRSWGHHSIDKPLFETLYHALFKISLVLAHLNRRHQ